MDIIHEAQGHILSPFIVRMSGGSFTALVQFKNRSRFWNGSASNCTQYPQNMSDFFVFLSRTINYSRWNQWKCWKTPFNTMLKNVKKDPGSAPDPEPKLNWLYRDLYHIAPPIFVVILPLVFGAILQTTWKHNLHGGGNYKSDHKGKTHLKLHFMSCCVTT